MTCLAFFVYTDLKKLQFLERLFKETQEFPVNFIFSCQIRFYLYVNIHFLQFIFSVSQIATFSLKLSKIVILQRKYEINVFDFKNNITFYSSYPYDHFTMGHSLHHINKCFRNRLKPISDSFMSLKRAEKLKSCA